MGKRQVQAKRFFKCDFCRGVIEINQFYMHVKERDHFGSYELKRHLDCQRTAELNDAANKSWW